MGGWESYVHGKRKTVLVDLRKDETFSEDLISLIEREE